jgi:hypothetical protein
MPGRKLEEVMTDWADKEAERLRLDLVESPANTAYFLDEVAKALRAAAERQREQDAKLADAFGEKRVAQLGGLVSGAAHTIAMDIRAQSKQEGTDAEV